jgi:signal transduction histidine kinase
MRKDKILVKSSLQECSETRQLKREIKQLTDKLNSFQKKSEIIDDLLHELRKINGELKKNLGRLIDSDTEGVYQTIWAIATTLSIRMRTYDFEVNPNFMSSAARYPIKIYQRIERAYRSVQPSYQDKHIKVELIGNNYDKFLSTDLIEIAFYTVLDNAFKYADKYSTIRISYKTYLQTLTVSISNEGILPDDDEVNSIYERGYRGRNTRDAAEGKGLGMSIFSKVCKACGIDYNIKLYRDTKEPIKGKYELNLIFHNCYQ